MPGTRLLGGNIGLLRKAISMLFRRQSLCYLGGNLYVISEYKGCRSLVGGVACSCDFKCEWCEAENGPECPERAELPLSVPVGYIEYCSNHVQGGQ
jgi:hypothetical protein